MLEGKRVLIAIGGGIAAYKVCEVISSLFKAGAEVRCILTTMATKFITPLTVTTLCRHPAYTDQDFWQSSHHRPLHIELGEWAELLVIAPLSANSLGKLTYGLADNLLTNTVLASRCPVLLVPAMNTEMWGQIAVQRNWQQLHQDFRYHSLSPGTGLLACDRVGKGRMAEPRQILPAIASLLHSGGQRDLSGQKILISAGGTQEYLDPVRFIGNPSTGKMGIALAQAAVYRGASVTLVHGSIADALTTTIPEQVHRIAVVSAREMYQAMVEQFPDASWTIMSAAVADVQPTDYSSQKLPKGQLPTRLPLKSVPDILTELGQRKQPHQRLIGFAAQTGDIVKPALEKLQRKKLDAIVANSIDQPNRGFGSDTNQVTVIDHQDQQTLKLAGKLAIAHHLFDIFQNRFV